MRTIPCKSQYKTNVSDSCPVWRSIILLKEEDQPEKTQIGRIARPRSHRHNIVRGPTGQTGRRRRIISPHPSPHISPHLICSDVLFSSLLFSSLRFVSFLVSSLECGNGRWVNDCDIVHRMMTIESKWVELSSCHNGFLPTASRRNFVDLSYTQPTRAQRRPCSSVRDCTSSEDWRRDYWQRSCSSAVPRPCAPST